jgi:hypothetical protein
MVDRVVHRAKLRATIASILRIMMKKERRALPALNGAGKAARANGAGKPNGAGAHD